MKKQFLRGLAVFAAFLAASGYLLYRHQDNYLTDHGFRVKRVLDTSGQAGPVAQVEVLQIREGTIPRILPACGSVIPAPGAQRVVSVPFECQVLEIFVSDGQRISKGNGLIEIQPSPATSLELEDAINAYNFEQEDLNQVKRRLSLKLATNEQVLQAKQRAGQTRTKLENLTMQGIVKRRKIDAPSGGLVRRVAVQEGNIVPAGNPLIEMVAENQLQIKLGVEPEDLNGVLQGQVVHVSHLSDPTIPAVSGQISKLSYELNSSTRLVDIFVKVPTAAAFLLGETIYGQIEVGPVQGLIVPRSSVLPEGSRSFVFIVRNDVAHKHYVRIFYETEKEYVISGEDISAGDQVVSLGNYTLEDGMQVQVKAAQ